MKFKTVKFVPGCCYETCIELLLLNSTIESLRLVHGYPRLVKGPNKGQRFGHAWLELINKGCEVVVDSSNQSKYTSKPLYYIVGRIEAAKCHIYTVDQAIEMLDEAKHCGPWKEGKYPKALFKEETCQK
jgi:hypothetical protein